MIELHSYDMDLLSVANTYVEDNATTLQMMGFTKTAGKIFQLYDNFNMHWCTCSTHE